MAPSITFTVGVLASVHFDDQPSFTAGKIGEVWADRQLANELVTVQAARAQFVP